MSDMGSETVYIPENLRPSRTPSYAAFLNENNFRLLKPGKHENGSLLAGPRRVFRLCFFALFLPTVLVTIPLYVRLVLYPPWQVPMMPTDQRLLGRHVSSVWCQAQSTHMNGSFTTYLAPDTPALKSSRQRFVMTHSTILRDDVKEYWGFHLLKGSKVTVSTCSSREGAQLMILRGVENLRRCAWIGEEDSGEEMDGEEDREKNGADRYSINPEIVTAPPSLPIGWDTGTAIEEEEEEEEDPSLANSESPMRAEPTPEDASEERRLNLQRLLQQAMKMSKSKKEILRILHSVGRGSDNKSLPKNIKKIMGVTSDEEDSSSGRVTPLRKKHTNSKNKTDASVDNSKLRLTRSVSQDIDDQDGAFEIFDEEEDPESEQNDRASAQRRQNMGYVFYPEGLKLENGKFNQTNKGDRSDEEHVSSYSSSEEALASCEGVILTLPLVSIRSCSERFVKLNKITYDIPITGTYYFVYSSENEIDANKVFLNMTFEKIMYDINESEMVCANTTECSVPISFWSNQKTVVEVPQESTWSNSYMLDTSCEPRVAIYLTFLLMVPLLILFCAFQ